MREYTEVLPDEIDFLWVSAVSYVFRDPVLNL